MCGIAGIWGNASNERLTRMADALRHRGPDDDGFWTHPTAGIGFAHRRLSIIDLPGGRQPIANEDGRIVTIFNGEIYNYQELRAELIGRGHIFTTQTDTEVIVHLYEELGEGFVARLRGMFAIALWDDTTQQLLLVRDRVGKKPLYFSDGGGEFVFASEIGGVRAGIDVALSIDCQALADYLAWSAVPAPATIYREMRAVEPGQLMVVRDRHIAGRTQYWRQELLPKVELSKYEAVERLDQTLRESVKLRLRSDVPVGCFLSGGIDSGLVTAMAAQLAGRRLTTITIGFEDDAFDERPLARMVAEQYDTDHHEVLIRPDVALDLPRIAAAYGQPFGDSSAIPSFYVAEAARRHVKVVLNGDGADELFAGYRKFVGAFLTGQLAGTGGSSRGACWRAVAQRLPAPRGYRSPYAFAHRLVRGMALDPLPRYMTWSIDGFDASALHALGGSAAGGDGSFLDGVEDSARLARPTLDGPTGTGWIDRMLATDFATILPNDLLVKIDIATMAHGLEARSPFLDHVLVDTVARLPERLKLSGMRTKPLLRELSRRYLPTPISTAPKRGFEVPLVRWLRGELRELAEDVLLSRDGLLHEMFDRAALERLLREGDGLDPARWSRRIWLLLMLGMWDIVVHRGQTPPRR